MAAQTEHYSMLAVLSRGYELRIKLNGHEFTLVEEGPEVVAGVNGEEHHFRGCRDNEIKQALEEYKPGAWRKPAWE